MNHQPVKIKIKHNEYTCESNGKIQIVSEQSNEICNDEKETQRDKERRNNKRKAPDTATTKKEMS